MILILEDTEQYKITLEFVIFLIKLVKKRYKKLLFKRHEKLMLCDKYLHDNNITKKYVLSKNILLLGLNNLVYVKTEKGYIIEINKNIKFDDKYYLSTLCKLINYGNKEIPGCNVITDTFNHFNRNINYYLNEFYKVKNIMRTRRFMK